MKKKSRFDKVYSGINIQFPISKLLLNGQKTIETRTYPIPEKYLNQEILMIETPGTSGNFKSRIVAIIKFTQCFRYKNEIDFNKDFRRHKVTKDSKWAWQDQKPKWGWRFKIIRRLNSSQTLEKRVGVRFTNEIKLK